MDSTNRPPTPSPAPEAPAALRAPEAPEASEAPAVPVDSAVQARLARVCEQAVAGLPELVEQVVGEIRAELADYAAVPVREQRRWVADHARTLLEAVAVRRMPGEEDVRRARELGRLRARQGLAIEVLLGGYHITYRRIWDVLLRGAAQQEDLTGHLAHLVAFLMTWSRTMTTSASDAYGEERRRDHVSQANLRHRFLAALAADTPDRTEAERLAHALGYLPEGRFQALCLPADRWPEERAERLQHRLSGLPGRPRCVIRGAVAVVIGQQSDPGPVLAAIRAGEERPGPVGVGLSRAGLAGAAASIEDAEDALRLAGQHRPTVDFGRDWIAVGLARQADRLAPLLTRAAAVAATDTHLADAVLAFADHGLSIAAAARALHLHPNSLAYRLGRWHERTGWDPRTGDGLSASLVALRLHPAGASSGS